MYWKLCTVRFVYKKKWQIYILYSFASMVVFSVCLFVCFGFILVLLPKSEPEKREYSLIVCVTCMPLDSEKEISEMFYIMTI